MTSLPRIACIGAGYWGKNLVRNFNELTALQSIVESSAERREQLKKEYPKLRVLASPDEAFSDEKIDAVVIATPAETHAELVRKAILAGKDVFVEKPLALSVAEARSLVDLAAEKKRILMVGHLLWYHPAVLKLSEMVKSGELGRIRYIYSNRLNLGKIRREENILWSFAPHDISVILGLVGEMPDHIQAQGGNYLHSKIADVTVSTLSFPSGVKAHIFVSWLHPFKEQKLVVVGERKMAVFNDMEPKDKLVLYAHGIEWKDNAPVPTKGDAKAVPFEAVEPLKMECSHFIECVQTRKTPRTDGHEGVKVLSVLDSCQKLLDSPAHANAAPEINAGRAYSAHPSAYVDEGVEIGEGTTIWHFSHVLKGSKIGKQCRIGQNVVIGPKVAIGEGVKIQNNVSVYEGVTLEDHVFCGPSMVFTNVYNPRSEIRRMSELRPTLVKRGATLGANCTILCGITIGQYGFIGAGAVVLRDVPDFALVVGNPGKVIGWMCSCGNQIRFSANGDAACSFCTAKYHKRDQSVSLLT